MSIPLIRLQTRSLRRMKLFLIKIRRLKRLLVWLTIRIRMEMLLR